jgi:hypothetical protein
MQHSVGNSRKPISKEPSLICEGLVKFYDALVFLGENF